MAMYKALAKTRTNRTPRGRRSPTVPSMQTCRPGTHKNQGRLLVAVGGPGVTPIAAGATAIIQFQITEAGWLDLLTLSETVTGNLFGLTLDLAEHNNVNLSSGTLPAESFSAFALPGSNPHFGRWANVNDQVQLTITNTTAAAVGVACMWSVSGPSRG